VSWEKHSTVSDGGGNISWRLHSKTRAKVKRLLKGCGTKELPAASWLPTVSVGASAPLAAVAVAAFTAVVAAAAVASGFGSESESVFGSQSGSLSGAWLLLAFPGLCGTATWQRRRGNVVVAMAVAVAATAATPGSD